MHYNYPFRAINITQTQLIEAYRCGAISLNDFSEAMNLSIFEAEKFLSLRNIKLVEKIAFEDQNEVGKANMETD